MRVLGAKGRESSGSGHVMPLALTLLIVGMAALVPEQSTATFTNSFALCKGANSPLCQCIDKTLEAVETPTDELPSFLDLEEGENMLRPSGTMCSDGSPWAFLASKFDTSKLILDFSGGGACWSAETCFDQALCDPPLSSTCRSSYFRTLTPDPSTMAAISCGFDLADFYPEEFGGFLSRSRSDNPFRSWSHVFVPYCTGDVHIGNNTHEYTNCTSSDCTIHHKGSVNAMRVVDWVVQEFVETDMLTDLMCFGDSAGAYGSVVYCAIIAEAARARGLDVNIAVVADSGVGLAAVSPTWGIENGALVHVFQNELFGHDTGFHPTDVSFDPFIQELQRASLVTNEAVLAFAQRFPDARVSMLTCDNDATQRLFMQYTYQDYGCHCCLTDACSTTADMCIAEADQFSNPCHEDCSTGCYSSRWNEDLFAVLGNLTHLPNFVPFLAECDLHTFVRSGRFFKIMGYVGLNDTADPLLVSDFVGALTDRSCSDPQLCSSASLHGSSLPSVAALVTSFLALFATTFF